MTNPSNHQKITRDITAIRTLMRQPGYPLDEDMMIDMQSGVRPSLIIPVIPIDNDQPANAIPKDALAALATAKALGGQTTLYIANELPDHDRSSSAMIRDAGLELADRYRLLLNEHGMAETTSVVTATDLSEKNARGRRQAVEGIPRVSQATGTDYRSIAGLTTLAADLSYLSHAATNTYELHAPITSGISGMPTTPRLMKLVREFRGANDGSTRPVIELNAGIRQGPNGMQQANLLAMSSKDPSRVPMEMTDRQEIDNRLSVVDVPVGYLTREVGHASRAQKAALDRVHAQHSMIAAVYNTVSSQTEEPSGTPKRPHDILKACAPGQKALIGLDA